MKTATASTRAASARAAVSPPAVQAGIETITCLSVRQPFASHLIFPHPKLGAKIFENRSWISRYRGTLFIHASRWEAKPDQSLCDQPLDLLWSPAGQQPPTIGAIIGCVDLIGSASQNDLDECLDVMTGNSRRRLTPEQQELRRILPDPATRAGAKLWEWYDGDAALIVTNPRALAEPIPSSGRLNLWKLNVRSDRLKFVSS